MVKNVGSVDRSFRFLISHILLLTGLWMLDGLHGNIIGIFMAIFALIGFFIAITGYCMVFHWFRFHSLGQAELKVYGHPYQKQ